MKIAINQCHNLRLDDPENGEIEEGGALSGGAAKSIGGGKNTIHSGQQM